MLSIVANTHDPRSSEREQTQPRLSLTYQLIIMMALGLTLVVATTMLPMDAVHEITHDARHALGFPCH